MHSSTDSHRDCQEGKSMSIRPQLKWREDLQGRQISWHWMLLLRSRCFGGTQCTYQHQSSEEQKNPDGDFAAFVPPQADKQPGSDRVVSVGSDPVPRENFTVKAVLHSGCCGRTRASSWLRPTRAPRGRGQYRGDPARLIRFRPGRWILWSMPRRNPWVPELQNGELY